METSVLQYNMIFMDLKYSSTIFFTLNFFFTLCLRYVCSSVRNKPPFLRIKKTGFKETTMVIKPNILFVKFISINKCLRSLPLQGKKVLRRRRKSSLCLTDIQNLRKTNTIVKQKTIQVYSSTFIHLQKHYIMQTTNLLNISFQLRYKNSISFRSIRVKMTALSRMTVQQSYDSEYMRRKY